MSRKKEIGNYSPLGRGLGVGNKNTPRNRGVFELGKTVVEAR